MARECKTGKPCGETCIAPNKQCKPGANAPTGSIPDRGSPERGGNITEEVLVRRIADAFLRFGIDFGI